MRTRRVLPLLLALATALGVAAPAAAKELTRVELCGRGDRCAAITDPTQLRVVPMGGSTSVAAPPLQPFYWMKLRIEHGGDAEPDQSVYYVPGANLLAANGVAPGRLVWLPIADPRSTRLLREATREIQPHPAPPSWPRQLKSTYRVVPDDELADPSPEPSPAPRPDAREHGDDAGVWPAAAVALAVGLGLAAAGLLLRRLASHQARDQLA